MKRVQIVVSEENTVLRVKTRNPYHYKHISFGNEEILIPVSATNDGWLEVR